jgi:alpha-tubulin suppressor-like RCC1 family protein
LKNKFGQLGIGSREEEKSKPTKIKSLCRIVKVDIHPRKSLAIDEKGRLYFWGIIDIDHSAREYLIPVLWSKTELVVDAQYIGTILYIQTERNTYLYGKHVKMVWCRQQHGWIKLFWWILRLIPKNVGYFITKIEFHPQKLDVIQFSKSTRTNFCDVFIIISRDVDKRNL